MAEEEQNAQTPTEPPAAPDPSPQPDPQADGGDQGKDGGTLLNGGGGDKPVAAPADWPEDWRAKFAGDDEKALKRLERFKSPQDIFKSFRTLEAKMSSGEVSTKLADDATDEDVAAWRKQNGIPEKPEGYLEALESGVVIGDDDKELVNSFLEAAHSKNASPEAVGAMLDWYYGMQEEQAAEIATADKTRREAAAEELRAEWGGEYRANINSVKAFLDAAPDGLSEQLLGARLADGTLLGDSPAALRWLVNMANEANPAGFVAPGAGGSQIETVESEIKQIETTMRTNRAAYDKDPAMQERYLKLLSAREKLNSRAA